MTDDDLLLGEPFALDVRRDGDVVVATARGELDLESADAFLDGVGRVPAGGRLAVDLRRLAFMDSSGVRALVRLDLRAVELDQTLVVVVEAGRMVEKLLELCGPGERLQVVHDPPSWAA